MEHPCAAPSARAPLGTNTEAAFTAPGFTSHLLRGWCYEGAGMEAEVRRASPRSKPSAITALLLRFALTALTSDGPAAQPWNVPPAAWPRTQCATLKSPR